MENLEDKKRIEWLLKYKSLQQRKEGVFLANEAFSGSIAELCDEAFHIITND
jgi:hypothetical protein